MEWEKCSAGKGVWAKMVPKMNPHLVKKRENNGSKIGPQNMKNEGGVGPTTGGPPVIYLKVDNLKNNWIITNKEMVI